MLLCSCEKQEIFYARKNLALKMVYACKGVLLFVNCCLIQSNAERLLPCTKLLRIYQDWRLKGTLWVTTVIKCWSILYCSKTCGIGTRDKNEQRLSLCVKQLPTKTIPFGSLMQVSGKLHCNTILSCITIFIALAHLRYYDSVFTLTTMDENKLHFWCWL